MSHSVVLGGLTSREFRNVVCSASCFPYPNQHLGHPKGDVIDVEMVVDMTSLSPCDFVRGDRLKMCIMFH